MQAIHNFRDAGGLPVATGMIREGLLYRSASLEQASESDVEELARLGIRTVCDLRTDQERRRNPDRLPTASPITSIPIPIKTSQHDDSGRVARLFSYTFGKARRLDYSASMEINYREFVTRFAPQFSQVIDIASDSSNLPLLIHCTAGKDRTGFACMVIQLALGAPADLVMQQYLLSNDHLHGFSEQMLRKLHLFSFGVPRDRFLPLFEARRQYMSAAFDQMQRDFGSSDRYLRDGLGLTDDRRRALGAALVESGAANPASEFAG
jgi:protein-tyrosine phosphatase